MSPKRRRWLSALVFVSPLLLGTWGCCSLKCRQNTAPILDVSSTDTVPVEEVRISKKAHQQVVWRLPSGSTVSNVAITLGGHPAPFENCVASEGYCRIACCNRSCVSGAINPTLDVPPGGIYYAYAFDHSPPATSSDPGIRIDP